MCKTATHDVQTLQKAEGGSIKDVSGPVVYSPSKTEHGLRGEEKKKIGLENSSLSTTLTYLAVVIQLALTPRLD